MQTPVRRNMLKQKAVRQADAVLPSQTSGNLKLKFCPEDASHSRTGENNWDDQHTCIEVAYAKYSRQPEDDRAQEKSENIRRRQRYEEEQARFQAEGNPNGSPSDSGDQQSK